MLYAHYCKSITVLQCTHFDTALQLICTSLHPETLYQCSFAQQVW